MPLKDDEHQTARYIKDLEHRISDLEEQLRSDSTPGILVRASEEIAIDDNVTGVRRTTIGSLYWSDPDSGWKTDAWGQYART